MDTFPLKLSLSVSAGFLGYKTYPNNDYVRLRWNPETLSKIDLPKFEYPVPKKELERIMALGHIHFSEILFWLQDYSEKAADDWLKYEPAMLSVSRLLAYGDAPEEILIEGNNWRTYVGAIDITREIVTIQRETRLLAALQSHQGFILVSAYHPLDAKSVRLIRELSFKPAPDGTVYMRPNNWEYARDQSVMTGNAYAAQRKESYLSYWKLGLGISNNGSIIGEWHQQRDIRPIESKYVAIQLQLKAPGLTGNDE